MYLIFLSYRRNANQKTIVNEAQSSLSSSIHMLKRRRSESSESDSRDSFDEDADEYGDESMNQKISNVSGIVAPEVYQQKKKKRRKLADKGTSTTNVSYQLVHTNYCIHLFILVLKLLMYLHVHLCTSIK